MDDNKMYNDFCCSLHKIGALKFGKFTLKSGRESAYYVDLRLLISYPSLMNDISSLIDEVISSKKIEFDCICGVPYTALPIATLASVKMNKAMVLRRKEPKGYGTKQLIEGKYSEGNHCIIIEDVVSTGASILETIADVESVGMIVKDVIVILDREEGGLTKITERGYNMHCLYKLSQVTEILTKGKLIDAKFLKAIETDKSLLSTCTPVAKVDRMKLSFEKRAELCKSAAAAALFTLMAKKRTNLCLAADVTDISDLLTLADEIGPYICILKLHIDMIEGYSEEERDKMKKIAAKHNFLIMEDRKLADIGNTVRLQFNQISKWATLVTAHSVSGFGLLEAIKSAESYNPNVGVFLVAEMSSKNNLITLDYTKKTMALAQNYPDVVAGVVSQSPVSNDPGIVQLTPGVSLVGIDDALGQQYQSPESVILDRGADVAVVGRAIINASNPVDAAKQYKKQLWDTYLQRVHE